MSPVLQGDEHEHRRRKDLRPLFRPASVALVGATPPRANRLGSWALRNLLLHDAGIPLLPVNPRYKAIEGLTCYRSLADLPFAPDLVLVMVPAAGALGVLHEADAAGARAAIVFGSGFGETAEGRAIEAELRAFTGSSSMAVCGPNTDGIINVADSIPCGFPPYAGEDDLLAGDVGVVSQSGALVSSLVMQLRRHRVGLSYSCAVGNAVDLDIGDYLHYLADDERTATILVYVEGIADRGSFLLGAERAVQAGKVVAVLKGGRSSEGKAAARSHTGALVGSYDAFTAMCEQHHILVADSLEHLAAIPSLIPAARNADGVGRRLGIVSGSGAVAGLITDKAREHGFDVPPFGPETERRLSSRLQFATPTNPVDLTGQLVHDPSLHPDVLDALGHDAGIDLVVSGMLFGPGDILARMRKELSSAADAGIPVVVFAADGASAVSHDWPEDGRVPVTASLDVLFSCLAQLVQHLPHLGAPTGRPPPTVGRVDRCRSAAARELLGGVAPGAPVPPARAWKLLELYGVPSVAECPVATVAEAQRTATELGWPVAVKGSAAGLAHKSDLGLVRLDIGDPEELASAVADLMKRIAGPGSRAVISREDGHANDVDVISAPEVVVQAMAPGGVEMIVSLREDPECGPVVVVGAGGLLVEVLGDTSIAPAPLDRDGARDLVDTLRASPLLAGVRGGEPLDRRALIEVVGGVSTMAVELEGELTELEINPVIVSPAGAVAVDVVATR